MNSSRALAITFVFAGLSTIVACSSDRQASEDLIQEWADQYEARMQHVCACQEDEAAKLECRETWSKAIDISFGEVTQGCLAAATKDAPQAVVLTLDCNVETEKRFTTCVRDFVVCDPSIDAENEQYKLCRNVYQEELKKCPELPQATREQVAQCVEDGGVGTDETDETETDTGETSK